MKTTADKRSRGPSTCYVIGQPFLPFYSVQAFNCRASQLQSYCWAVIVSETETMQAHGTDAPQGQRWKKKRKEKKRKEW